MNPRFNHDSPFNRPAPKNDNSKQKRSPKNERYSKPLTHELQSSLEGDSLSASPGERARVRCRPSALRSPLRAHDLSDTAFKLLYAAAVHKDEAARRRIPIRFLYDGPKHEYLNQKQ